MTSSFLSAVAYFYYTFVFGVILHVVFYLGKGSLYNRLQGKIRQKNVTSEPKTLISAPTERDTPLPIIPPPIFLPNTSFITR